MESQNQASHPFHRPCKSRNPSGIYTFPPPGDESSLINRLTRKTKPETLNLGWARIKCRSGPVSVAKGKRWAQVKSHAGGSLAAGKDPDFFFDRVGQFGPNLGVFAFSSRDGNDFAWFAHGRF